MKKLFLLCVSSMMLVTLVHAQQIRGGQIKNNTVPLNVKDYGATGNGTTSDYGSIKNTINRSNAIVTIPNGTYLIDTTIVLNNVSNLRITGNSGATFQGPLHQLIQLTGTCVNVEIDGLSFNSTAVDSATVDYYGILTNMGSFTNLYIHNCNFSSPHCQTNGIKMIVEGSNTASDLNIQNCNFTNIGRMGVELQNQTDTITYRLNNVNISNNYFNNTGTIHSQLYGMAISLTGIGKGAALNGNVVVDPRDYGIENAGWSDVAISNNTIRAQNNTAFTGISITDDGVSGGPSYPKRVAVVGNIVDNPTGYSNRGMLAQNLNGYTFTGNVIKAGGGGIGIFLSYDGVISGNSIIGGTSTTSSSGGGLLFSGSSDNLATSNYINVTLETAYVAAIYYNAQGSVYSNNNVVTPDNVLRLNSTGIGFTQETGNLNNSISLGSDPIAAAASANYTVPRSTLFITLPVLTVSRTITVPAPASYPGQNLIIQNSDTSGSFTWSFGGSVVNAAGTAITTLTSSTVYQLTSNGTNWVKTN